MKKLMYLILLALILGLVLTGCLLSNVGQVPTNEQSGVNSIAKNTITTNMICFGFEEPEFIPGNTVLGEGSIYPFLDIYSSNDGLNLVIIEKGGTQIAYNTSTHIDNDCLDGIKGFGPIGAGPENRPLNTNTIIFEFTQGAIVSSFSIKMYDYGDWIHISDLFNEGEFEVTLNAYAVDDVTLIDSDSYSISGGKNSIFDACNLKGMKEFIVTGSGISKVEMEFTKNIDIGVGFDDICFTTIEVPVDIKPTSCPNPINTKSNGVTPVAILGTLDFDVTQIDPVTVTLAGASPLRWDWEDVATPFEPYTGKGDCLDCNTIGPDGYLDLTLKFDTQGLLAAIESLYAIGTVESFEVNEEELNTLESGVDDQVTTITGEILAVRDCIVIQLEGLLLDGTPIIGEDVVRILEKGKK